MYSSTIPMHWYYNTLIIYSNKICIPLEINTKESECKIMQLKKEINTTLSVQNQVNRTCRISWLKDIVSGHSSFCILHQMTIEKLWFHYQTDKVLNMLFFFLNMLGEGITNALIIMTSR